MQGTAPSLPVQTPLQIILLIASALLVGARLAGVNLPLLRTDRAVFFTLALIGIMMCSSGMKVAEYGWLNPFTVAGMAAGALDWFDGFTCTNLPGDQALLTGPVADQAALYGLLARLRDLNLTLLAVNPAGEAEPTPPPAPRSPA